MSTVSGGTPPTPPGGGEEAPAAAKKTVVVQLKPVSFQLTLHYMGHERIKHEQATYRCKYKLLKEAAVAAPIGDVTRADPATTVQNPLAVIANVVREKTDSDPGAKPALPAANKGDSSNPDPDEMYRIEVLDNHGISVTDLMDVIGGKKSKPQVYGSSSWLPAIKPAVPFRAVLRKFVGDDEVPMTDEMELVFEIKDPKEEFDQTDGNRKAFLNKFYKKYNRTDKDPTVGEDNALKVFGGVREPSAGYPGVKALNVLKKIPYKTPPFVVETPGAAGAVTFAELSAVDQHGPARALLKFVPGEDKNLKHKVGIADFAFLPPPIGGDNYRFLLTVRGVVKGSGAGKSDIRDQKVNGKPVTFLDDQKKQIKGKCAYTTGRFVMWRRVQFRMIVTCNGMAANGINFASVAETYRRSFVEVEPPMNVFNADWKVWRDALQARYMTALDPWFNDANQANLELAYAEGFIPGTMTVDPKFKFNRGGTVEYNFDLDPDVHALTKYLIRRSCIDPPTKRTDPNGHNQQSYDKPDSDGLYILFAKRKSPDTSDGTLGEYLGDRMFYMYESAGNPNDTTDTCAHELGHTLSLAHSLTRRERFKWNGGAQISVMDSVANCAFHDHDQDDAATCLMSYISSSHLELYPYHPCGVCALCLRFYDKLELQKPGSKPFGESMSSGVKPATIVRLHNGTKDLLSPIPDLPVGTTYLLVCVGQLKNWPSNGGTFPARVGLSGLANFTAAGVGGTPGSVNIDPGIFASGAVRVRKVTGATAGRVEVRFSHEGITASAQFNVV